MPRTHRVERHSLQQELPFPKGRGGRRANSGRKRLAPRAMVPHRARPEHSAGHPVHVTLRSRFRPLRSQHVFPTVCLALGRAAKRDQGRFRILHFSVQWDHVHLVVEASDKRALSEGLRSVAIRTARYVNELVNRRGRFWADRWHGRALTSPREVRNALVYVLANFKKHTKTPPSSGIDAFSSAVLFDGWRGFHSTALMPRAGPPFERAHERGARRAARGDTPLVRSLASFVVVSRPTTWLARTGWRRHGLIRVDERPSEALVR